MCVRERESESTGGFWICKSFSRSFAGASHMVVNWTRIQILVPDFPKVHFLPTPLAEGLASLTYLPGGLASLRFSPHPSPRRGQPGVCVCLCVCVCVCVGGVLCLKQTSNPPARAQWSNRVYTTYRWYQNTNS